MRLLSSILITFSFLIFSCSKEEESQTQSSSVKIERQVIQDEIVTTKESSFQGKVLESSTFKSSWGVPFRFDSVNESSKEEVFETSRAIALIRGIDRTEATGFFVSSDGLFLTNHHVINDLKCKKNICHGFKIIRDFKEGGELEVFEQFEILALHRELDYALLKVDIKEKEVPFLRLNTSAKLQKGDGLKIQGHPFGAPQKATQALLASQRGGILKLQSHAVNGNSGSPVVLEKNQEVVGLYYEGSWDKTGMSLTGEVKHFGVALSTKTLLQNVKKIYPHLSLGSRGLELGNKKVQDVLMDNEVRSQDKSFVKFFHTSFGENTNWSDFNELQNEFAQKLKSATTPLVFHDLSLFINNVARLQSIQGMNITLTQISEDFLKAVFNYEKEEKYNNALYPFLVSFSLEDQRECEDVVYRSAKAQSLHLYHSLSSICLSTQTQRESVLDSLLEKFSTFWSEDESLVFSLVLNQLERMKALSEPRREALYLALKDVKSKTESLKTKFNLENILLALRDEETRQKVLRDWSFKPE